MLTLNRVTRTFNNGLTGFNNISLSIEKGEIIGVLGTSGCGKSTLLRVLSGLDDGFEGEISLKNETEQFGMIFQEPRLMPWLDVLDNVRFGAKTNKQSKVYAQELLDLVGLGGFEKHLPKDLSGGMAQRTAIARALMTKPDVLLLDEPFSALDAFTKMQLQDLLLSIWETRQATMVLVTHDIDEALYLCDRIIVLRGQPGEVYAEIDIPQQKPRSRGDISLAEKKSEILNLLDLNKQEEQEAEKELA